MDSFEQILRLYLEEENYWTRHSVKLHLSKADKIKLMLPTMPRIEIDLVAFDVISNILIVIEAKSFLNSRGVDYNALCGDNSNSRNRYRLFNDTTYRQILKNRLKKEFISKKLINKNTKIKFALAAGKVQSRSESKVESYLKKNGFLYFTPEKIKEGIRNFSLKGWENNLIVMTTKLVI
jgi:hypothetical protein